MVWSRGCLGDKWVEQPDCDSAGQAQSHAFLGSFGTAGKAAIGDGIKHNGGANQRNSAK